MRAPTREDLLNSPHDLLAILRSSPDLYLILNSCLQIVAVSEAYVRATMVNREDIMNRDIFEVFPDNPSDPNATGVRNLRESLQRVLQFKAPDSMAVQKYDIKRPESEGGGFEERYWSPVNSPVFDENGEVKYIIHRVEDVTHYVLLNQSKIAQQVFADELRSRFSDMEREIYRRAQEIQEINKQLREAVITAEEANRAKGEFLAAMSHEIRTPLNGILGMTGILLQSEMSADLHDSLEIIHLSGEGLLHVINDILDFSKIEAGHLEIENVDFNLHALIDEIVEIISPQVYKKGVEIGADIDSNVPTWMNGDPSRIRQVLNNILGNAAKFTETGEIGLKVTTTLADIESDDKKLLINFEVYDTGIGMSQETLNQLFKPFYQGDASITRRYGGTGLGLAISKRLVEMMQGNISISSKAGKGSEFTITLPLALCPSRIPTVQFELPPELHNGRILCIDDSRINRSIIKHLIDSWSMRCDIAENAEKGLAMLTKAALEKDPYKLVFIDDNMPNASAFELIKTIRKTEGIARIPIVLLSSIMMGINVDKLNELKIVMILLKPIRKIKLYDCITSVLSNAHTKIIKPIQYHDYNKKLPPVKAYRILLVEDNSINQIVALKILSKLGFTADIANNGNEALDAIAATNYDLILMDCQMPEKDGYATTKEIRAKEAKQNKHTYIIAMTAHALKGDEDKCLAAGMDDYISKPIDLDNIYNKLKTWLEKMERMQSENK